MFLSDFFKSLKNNLYLVKKIWHYSKSGILLKLLNCLIAPLQPFIFIFLLKTVLDGLAMGKSFNTIMHIVILGILVAVIQVCITSFVKKISDEVLEAILSKHFQSDLFHKLIEIEIACYEDPEFYNKYTISLEQADRKAIEILNLFTDIFSGLISLILLSTYLISLSPIVIVVCIVILVLNIFLNSKSGKLYYKRDKETASFIRGRKYIKNIFYSPKYAQELRLGNLSKILIDKYSSFNNAIIRIIKNYRLCFFMYDVGFGLVGYMLFFIVMIISIIQISSGKLTIGAFVALLNGAEQVLEKLFQIFGSIPNIQKNDLYINDLKYLMEYQPKISGKYETKIDNLPNKDIEFRNVSFKYPNTKKYVLKDINLTIKDKSKICLVGYNGAGKTTIIKLLLRFYDPDEGNIYIGGINYKDIDLYSLRAYFGVVFQDYECYALTVRENIQLKSQYDKETASICDFVGILSRINKLPRKFDTIISNEIEGGIALSGGEQQKIAIARALYNKNGALVFDEPSSSLDPMAEYELNKKISLLKNKNTIILISHRLSNVIDADSIYFIEQGIIIEQGNHHELLANNGKYKQFFDMQSEGYKAENSPKTIQFDKLDRIVPSGILR